MTHLVAYAHLNEYIYPQGHMTNYFPVCVAMAHASLGLFTFISGYLLGRKYCFGQQENGDVRRFYQKRIMRIIPLFVVASIVLWIIDFNNARSTVNGLLYISPFVDPKPRTLYYIPVILWCYLVTPLISRRDLKWRVIACLSLWGVLLIARFLFQSIDSRFVFNVFFYFVGVVSASCFDWKLSTSFGRTIKLFVVLAFVTFVAVAPHYSLLFSGFRQMVLGAVGVFVILFICEGISSLFFDDKNAQQNPFKVQVCRIVSIVSYASMACYMFHRFFYWAAEKVWNPSDITVKWLFMVGLVFPIIITFSYMIQKLYDKSVFIMKSHKLIVKKVLICLSVIVLTFLSVLVVGAIVVKNSVIHVQLPHGAVLHVLLAPKDNQVNGAVIICPGGGYSFLAKWVEGYWWFPFFYMQGYTPAMLEYRMPEHDCHSPMIDGSEAVRMMRQHAKEWHFDENNVGIMGFSAGGHLASTIIVTDVDSVRPNFGILFYSVISMKKELTHMRTHNNLLGEDASEELEAQFSNELHISDKTPPTFLAHSSDDKKVIPQNSIRFRDEMLAHNRPVTLHLYPSGGHGWGYKLTFDYHRQVLEDLTEWLSCRKSQK
jgi:acetyl esterase/lipase/peptidoglycan/LPS O-acetylase OafA/YrhL